MMIEKSDLKPGIYQWDGENLTTVMSCDDCAYSMRSRLMALAQEIRDKKLQAEMLAEIERGQWSGAGYD